MPQHSRNNANPEGYDPFEPGHSTPEFERFARENYGTPGRTQRAAAPGGARRIGTTVLPGSHARPAAGRAAADPYAAAPAGGYAPVPSADMPHARSARSTIVGVLVCLLIAVAVEVFGFNFSFFSSMLYPEITSAYTVAGAPAGQEGTLSLSASDDDFEIAGLDDTVKSISFTVALADPAAAAAATDGKVQVVMYLRDEGNASYYALPSVSVDPARGVAHIDLDPAGKCHAIKVSMTNLADTGSVTVTGVGLNERVPFSLDPLRAAFVFALLLVLYALRPQSSLYSLLLAARSSRRTVLVAGLVAAEVVCVFALVLSNTHFVSLTQTPSTENYFQYQKLAHALLEGHLYLDDVPSAALAAMDNPYDTAARAAQGVPYLWDHAYFEGRYYVYFGILPCLVFYVPWLLLTGTGFPTWLGVAICDAAFAVGVAFLLHQVCRRWFPRTSVGVFLVLDVMLFVAGGGIILARTPSMYFLPEAMGLALVAWGVGLWVRGTSGGFIDRRLVTAGSALVALTLAARPQMMLAAAVGLVLFWPFLRASAGDAGARRQVWGAFRAALAPFLVVGVLVCAYNFLRFGSPLDFGANYNLTTNDMTHRGFHLDRIPFGLYAYLVQPPVLGSQFPFLRQAYLDPAYQGITIYEPMYGGYFFLYPMTLALLAFPRVRRGLAEKGLVPLFALACALGLALVVFDLQGAGILMRYVCDFGIWIALAAALVFLELLQVRGDAPLTRGWTTMMGGAHAPASAGGGVAQAVGEGAGVETVSVYRMSLYFLCGSLVVMVCANVLLWEAFGMY